MEPFYTKAEQMYQVHGFRGVDPTEPPARAPYPYPPVSHEPRIEQLFDDLNVAGYHPFAALCGIMLNEQDMADSKCIRCRTCQVGRNYMYHNSMAVLAISKEPNPTFFRKTITQWPMRFVWPSISPND